MYTYKVSVTGILGGPKISYSNAVVCLFHLIALTKFNILSRKQLEFTATIL